MVERPRLLRATFLKKRPSLCYSASSERKLLLHKLMCIVISAVVIALCKAIRMVCLHDVSMIAIGVEGADQGEEEPSHHHVARGMSLPHEPSQYMDIYIYTTISLIGYNNRM
jgi:hypothetical protein